MTDALRNSSIVAIPNAILATIFGTMAALGLQRVGKQVRLGYDTLTYISVIVPEIVIALATLVFFATGFDCHQVRRSAIKASRSGIPARSSPPTCCST